LRGFWLLWEKDSFCSFLKKRTKKLLRVMRLLGERARGGVQEILKYFLNLDVRFW